MKVAAAKAAPGQVKKSNHFPVLSEQQIDEIASNTVKAKTRKQTVIFIDYKVFRGKEISFFKQITEMHFS